MFTVSVTQCSLEQVGGEQHKPQKAQEPGASGDPIMYYSRGQEAKYPWDQTSTSRSGAGEKAAVCSAPVLHAQGFSWDLLVWP